jgi:hypothetical protein
MYTFTNISALCDLVAKAYRAGAGTPGRQQFAEVLRSRFEFGDRAADKYASTVLQDNNASSAETVRINAVRLVGTWRNSTSTSLADVGYGGNALRTRIEEWTFSDDLTYAYSLEMMTSAMSPWGSWSRPSTKRETGLWVPPDRLGASMDILILADGERDREVRIDWLDANDATPKECRIDLSRFYRQ